MEAFQESNTRWENHLTALADSYRRQLLVALLEQNPQNDDQIDALDAISKTGVEAEMLRTELVHSHLPQLADMGYINWERDRGKLSPGPNWHEIAPLPKHIHENRDELPVGWL
jgi:hypothetical protein